MRPAAAKTIHRSQGDTEQRIVVNFSTKRAIPHIHYVGLSRVTTIEGLYITDLCEEKIAVNPNVIAEMELLGTERAINLVLLLSIKWTRYHLNYVTSMPDHYTNILMMFDMI